MSVARIAKWGVGYPLVIIVLLALLPISVPMAIGRNYYDLADRLDGLPGIRAGGGPRAALVAFGYFACIFLLVGSLNGVSAVTGDSTGTQSATESTVTESTTPPESTTSPSEVSPPTTEVEEDLTTEARINSNTSVSTISFNEDTDKNDSDINSQTTELQDRTTTRNLARQKTTTDAESANNFKNVFNSELKQENTTISTVLISDCKGNSTLLVYNRTTTTENATLWITEWLTIGKAYTDSVENNTAGSPERFEVVGKDSNDSPKYQYYYINKTNAIQYNNEKIETGEYIQRYKNTIQNGSTNRITSLESECDVDI